MKTLPAAKPKELQTDQAAAKTRRARALNSTQRQLTALIALIGALYFHADAQSYNIDWYKVAGGGGTSTGGVFTINGTIGQPDASGAMTGGNYSLTGGFWAIYAVQTTGAPLLTITHVGNKAIVSWDQAATGWTLQTNVNLATPGWGNYLGSVVNNNVTNSPPPMNLFFRLTHP